MLPPESRLRSSEGFARAIKTGRKKGSRTVVVYVLQGDGIIQDGPRAGLVVSKAVGNAVKRHGVSRLIRHALRDIFDAAAAGDPPSGSEWWAKLRPEGRSPDWYSPGTLIVVRALPASAHATFKEVRADVASCIRRASKS